MKTNWYVLDENMQPVPADIREAAKFMAQKPLDMKTPVRIGLFRRAQVSTVFLGLDHSWLGEKPILFETMIFGKNMGYQRRYETWDEAIAGHYETVGRLIGGGLQAETEPTTRFTGCAGSMALGSWWFRICGYGLNLKSPRSKPLFSERNARHKILKWKGWRVWVLKP